MITRILLLLCIEARSISSDWLSYLQILNLLGWWKGKGHSPNECRSPQISHTELTFLQCLLKIRLSRMRQYFSQSWGWLLRTSMKSRYSMYDTVVIMVAFAEYSQIQLSMNCFSAKTCPFFLMFLRGTYICLPLSFSLCWQIWMPPFFRKQSLEVSQPLLITISFVWYFSFLTTMHNAFRHSTEMFSARNLDFIRIFKQISTRTSFLKSSFRSLSSL